MMILVKTEKRLENGQYDLRHDFGEDPLDSCYTGLQTI